MSSEAETSGRPTDGICADAGFHGWIGVAREEITPPVGIYARSWGAAQHDVAEGIHRPLTATALTLRTAPTAPPLVLIALDLGWWRTKTDERQLRGRLMRELKLERTSIVIALSHTHAGPSICREDTDKPGGHLVGPYLFHLRETVIRLTRQALENSVPATVTWKTGHCDLAQNRDLPDPERPRLVCGYNPQPPDDAAPDDTLLVGRVTGEDGRVLATLVNYACHPTILAWENRLISPDYVGALREVVEGATDGAPCLFLQGASGELGAREQYTADTAVADAAGAQVGYAVLATLQSMLPPGTGLRFEGVTESGASLAVWRRTPHPSSRFLNAMQSGFEVALKAGPTRAEVEARLEQLRQDGSDPVLAERLTRRLRIMHSIGDGRTACLLMWAWRIGDALLVAQPNEAYSWFQTELRRRFHPHPVLVVNIANGPYCGYLPPRALYGQDLYPVWQTPFEAGSLERTYEVAQRVLNRLLTRDWPPSVIETSIEETSIEETPTEETSAEDAK
jgi:hypothetical protein